MYILYFIYLIYQRGKVRTVGEERGEKRGEEGGRREKREIKELVERNDTLVSNSSPSLNHYILYAVLKERV
jgi:hypothetical protein